MHRSRSCIVSGQFIAMFSGMAKKVKISRNLILGRFHFFFHFAYGCCLNPNHSNSNRQVRWVLFDFSWYSFCVICEHNTYQLQTTVFNEIYLDYPVFWSYSSQISVKRLASRQRQDARKQFLEWKNDMMVKGRRRQGFGFSQPKMKKTSFYEFIACFLLWDKGWLRSWLMSLRNAKWPLISY